MNFRREERKGLEGSGRQVVLVEDVYAVRWEVCFFGFDYEWSWREDGQSIGLAPIQIGREGGSG